MHYYDFVCSPGFFLLLLEIDRSIAAEAHGQPCAYCGDQLNCADFWRVGYGLPAKADDECRRRFSFCCRRDGCRRRRTPESVRFLRGMAYVAVVIVLMSALEHGLSPTRVGALQEQLNVSRQTIAKWLKWWRERFAPSPFWRARRGRFMPVVDEARLAFSLLGAFEPMSADAQDVARALLRFLAPFR